RERLLSYILKLTHKYDDAEDIVQETFFRAFNSLASFSSKDVEKIRLWPWLRKIAHNIFITMLRKQKIVPESYDNPTGQALIETLEGSPLEQPEAILEDREFLEKLDTLLKSLPPKYYKAVVLRHIIQHPYTKVADILGISVQKAKGR